MVWSFHWICVALLMWLQILLICSRASYVFKLEQRGARINTLKITAESVVFRGVCLLWGWFMLLMSWVHRLFLLNGISPRWMFSISLSQKEDQSTDPRLQLAYKRAWTSTLLSFLLSFHSRHHLANKLCLWDFLLTNIFSFSQQNSLDMMFSCYLFLFISLIISFRDVRVSTYGKCPVICFDASCFYYET